MPQLDRYWDPDEESSCAIAPYRSSICGTVNALRVSYRIVGVFKRLVGVVQYMVGVDYFFRHPCSGLFHQRSCFASSNVGISINQNLFQVFSMQRKDFQWQMQLAEAIAFI